MPLKSTDVFGVTHVLKLLGRILVNEIQGDPRQVAEMKIPVAISSDIGRFPPRNFAMWNHLAHRVDKVETY